MHCIMGTIRGSTKVGQEAEGEGELWASVFVVVSAGKNG